MVVDVADNGYSDRGSTPLASTSLISKESMGGRGKVRHGVRQ